MSDLETLKKEANNGDGKAQFDLGIKYSEDGNHKEAFIWLRLSAEKNSPSAQNNVGVAYANGNGVVKNICEGIKWFKLAAKQKYALSQRNLGDIYFNGIDVPVDYVESFIWYKLAAIQGDEEAIKMLPLAEEKMNEEKVLSEAKTTG